MFVFKLAYKPNKVNTELDHNMELVCKYIIIFNFISELVRNKLIKQTKIMKQSKIIFVKFTISKQQKILSDMQSNAETINLFHV